MIGKENKLLFKWFAENKRSLPFRENRDPYKIWISEVMLQQTRVSAMLPSFQRFIKLFPDIKSLAEAKDEDVVKAWKGLGYYSRALNLHKGAVFIANNFNCNFPEELEEALSVPGVGPYTARAVLSIAFNKPLAVLDGNVKRVLSRYYLYEKNISLAASHKELQKLADEFLNTDSPGAHNEAMMELGATICIQTPLCMLCPIQKNCLAFKEGKQNVLPITGKEKEKLFIQLLFLLIEKEGKILLLKEKKRRFFKTIYTPPFLIEGKNLKDEYHTSLKFLGKDAEKTIKKDWMPAGKHSITHHEIELFYKTMKNIDLKEDELAKLDHKWVLKKDLGTEFPSSIAGKILKNLKG